MTQLQSRSTPDPEPVTEAEIISVPEWARRIDISKESAYKAVRRGEVPGAFVVGRLVRVNWTAFIQATGSSAA
jgi:predicted DNA-binding transcriptional regulator AlpA